MHPVSPPARRWISFAVGALTILLVAALVLVRTREDAADDTASPDAAVERESPSRDAIDTSSDVTITSCGDGAAPTVAVTNSSATAARYLVVVDVAAPDGSRGGSAGARLPAVEPGDTVTATLEVQGDVRPGSTCTVRQVIRTPS